MKFSSTTFATGYARNAGMSRYPHLWKGLEAFYAPMMGNQGARLYDFGYYRHQGNLAHGPSWEVGENGYELKFNIGQDYVNVPHHDRLNPRTGSFTVAVLVKVDSAPTGGVFISKSDGRFDNGYALVFYESTSKFSVVVDHVGGPVWQQFSIRDFTLGSYYLVTGVIDRVASLLKLYVDGKPEGSMDISGLGDINPSNPLNIARYVSGPNTLLFAGSVAFVGIWSRALHEAEIRQLSIKPLAPLELAGLFLLQHVAPELLGLIDIKNPQIEANNYDKKIAAINYDNKIETNNHDYQIEWTN
jgi:hypothetical protein